MRISSLVLGATFGVYFAFPVFGAEFASHLVSFDFQEINEISVTGSPDLSISSAVPGQGPIDATDTSTAVAVTTNGADKRITARIDMAMPEHTTLMVSVVAPSESGTSSGNVTLTTSATNVVTGISQVADSSCAAIYTLSATVQAGVSSSDTRTVTFTLSD